MAAPAPLQAQELEVAVKAAYLPKFAPFVDWPAHAPQDGPVMICIVGQDRFGSLIDQAVHGQALGPRPLAVKRMIKVDAAAGCHIAYLGGSRQQSAAEALSALRGAPVLTVTDQAVGDTRGMIHFVRLRNRVRFHINNAAAQANGVRLSSKLLALALSV